MAEILHKLRLVVYPIVYRVPYIPGGDRQISAINSMKMNIVLFSWNGEMGTSSNFGGVVGMIIDSTVSLSQ